MDRRASVTAVFVGGDAYISPSLYETRRAVPTWNYAVVHAYGTVRLMHDSDSKEQVLKSLIDRHDAAYRRQWDELDPAYREGMKGGIVAFVITIERLQAKFKLSQNRSAAERARVLDAMERGDDRARALGGWMRALGEPRE
jgi:transcriptional regulator